VKKANLQGGMSPVSTFSWLPEDFFIGIVRAIYQIVCFALEIFAPVLGAGFFLSVCHYRFRSYPFQQEAINFFELLYFLYLFQMRATLTNFFSL
jgi:hypothetical protein